MFAKILAISSFNPNLRFTKRTYLTFILYFEEFEAIFKEIQPQSHHAL